MQALTIIPAAPVGYFAAALVFATFYTKRMVPLRAFAIASNIAFIGYGYLGDLLPILILHAAMLPMNILRFKEVMSFGGSCNETRGRTLSNKMQSDTNMGLENEVDSEFRTG